MWDLSKEHAFVVSHILLWNTEELSWEASTTGSGVGQAVSVENFPAVMSGASIPVEGTFYPEVQTVSNVNDDPTSKYKITDIDPTEGNSYFGYVDAGGAWYIMNLTATTARYVKGESDYTAAWGNKGNLNYDYFNNIF